MKDVITISGSVSIKLFEKGKLVKSIQKHNLILYAGENYIANRMALSPDSVLTDISIGTGIAEPDKSDLTLFNEVAKVNILTGPYQGTGAAANTVVMDAFFSEGVGTGSITEAGLWHNSILFARTLFDTALDKTATSSLHVEWVLHFESCT